MKKEYEYPYTPSPFLPDLDALKADEKNFQSSGKQGEYPEEPTMSKENGSDAMLEDKEANFPE